MDNLTLKLSNALCLAAGLWLVMPPAHAAQPDVEGWIPFDGRNGRIVLQGSVHGESAQLILDSGATVGAVSAEFAERAGIESDRWQEFEISGVFDNRRVPASQRFELELNESTISLIGLPIVPRGGFDLLLGRPVFENAVVQIDYPNERIRFLDPDVIEFEGNVEVRRGLHGDLMLEVMLQDNRAWLMLDTGNSGPTVLKRRFVQRHGLETKAIESIRMLGEGVINTGGTRMLQLENAAIGPFRFDNFLASYIDESNRGMDHRHRIPGSRIRRERSRHDGLLGYEILKNFLVTADFKNARVHLHVE